MIHLEKPWNRGCATRYSPRAVAHFTMEIPCWWYRFNRVSQNGASRFRWIFFILSHGLMTGMSGTRVPPLNIFSGCFEKMQRTRSVSLSRSWSLSILHCSCWICVFNNGRCPDWSLSWVGKWSSNKQILKFLFMNFRQERNYTVGRKKQKKNSNS